MWTFGRAPQSIDRAADLRTAPDWKQADPRWIRQALGRALAKPSGGWYVMDASSSVPGAPTPYTVANHRLVVWRANGALVVAPDSCPHMGASLAGGRVRDCKLICPWHGLALGGEGHGGWRPLPSHDDGVLLWVRLAEPGQAATPRPYSPVRPRQHISAVVRMEARCEPEDVIANRLDPWHGTHLHSHSFARLNVIDRTDDSVTCRVAYRIVGRIGIEVDAHFSCPDPRTIVMTIIDGEGTGSVVETHASPISPGRTAIVEAALATSERLGFRAARMVSPVLRAAIRWAARRLWVEDADYAERRYCLRRSSGAFEP